jgi:nucleoside-diphosphate-sugar epimerase
MPILFCFGCGYTATTLARRLLSVGWQVRGTVRSPAKAEELRAQGIEPHLFRRDQPLADPATTLAGVTHLLTSIAPDADGDPVLAAHLADLQAVAGLAWAGYLGTTGVYGDHAGAWVDETTPIEPTVARADRRARAEAAWLQGGLPIHVFRLAGIYGPGRNAFVNLRHGTAHRIVKPGQYFSRIHVDDIATTLQASIARPNPGRIYNVCDDEPAPPQDIVTHAARLQGIAPPPEQPYATASLSPMARTFYLDNRRVRNARIKHELGVTLRYPTYREGLQALLAIDGRK